MIHKFNQFVNENRTNAVSVYDAINEPVNAFIERAKERLEIFIEKMQETAHEMDKAVKTVMEDFSDFVVGEPIITVDDDLSDITVMIHTNAPNNDEAWKADESPALELERRLSRYLSDINIHIADIYYKPDDDGNCIIELHTYLVDETHFGEYTDALAKFGEEY
jgi:hypothetical protein